MLPLSSLKDNYIQLPLDELTHHLRSAQIFLLPIQICQLYFCYIFLLTSYNSKLDGDTDRYRCIFHF